MEYGQKQRGCVGGLRDPARSPGPFGPIDISRVGEKPSSRMVWKMELVNVLLYWFWVRQENKQTKDKAK